MTNASTNDPAARLAATIADLPSTSLRRVAWKALDAPATVVEPIARDVARFAVEVSRCADAFREALASGSTVRRTDAWRHAEEALRHSGKVSLVQREDLIFLLGTIASGNHTTQVDASNDLVARVLLTTW